MAAMTEWPVIGDDLRPGARHIVRRRAHLMPRHIVRQQLLYPAR